MAGERRTTEESRSPEEIQADIEATREELGDTVGALADKAEVKKQAKRKVEEIKAKAAAKKDEINAKAHEIKDRAAAKADEASEKAREAGPGPAQGGAEQAAPQAAEEAVRAAQENPVAAAA